MEVLPKRRIERSALVGGRLHNVAEPDLVEVIVEVAGVVEDARELWIRAHRRIGERDQKHEDRERQPTPQPSLFAAFAVRDLPRHARRARAIPMPHIESGGTTMRANISIGDDDRGRGPRGESWTIARHLWRNSYRF
jgi:hypothetical protein